MEVEVEPAGTPLSLRNGTSQSSPSCQTVWISILLPHASLGRTKDQHTVTIACHLPSCCHHTVRIWAQALKGQSAHLHKYQSLCTNQSPPPALLLISIIRFSMFHKISHVISFSNSGGRVTNIWGPTRSCAISRSYGRNEEYKNYKIEKQKNTNKTFWILLEWLDQGCEACHGDMVLVEHFFIK